jgi:uncharacterized membrane protein HdeD (DUF308 family)
MTLIESIQKDAKTAKWIGIFLMIAGILALLSPLAAGLSIAVIIGAILLANGVAELLLVFKAGSFGEGILLALMGVLAIAAGGYMISQPGAALGVLTLFLAAYFVATGIVEVFGAFGARPAEGWGWLLTGGIVSLLLGLMIWRQFPLSGVWAVGILVGARLLVTGSTLMAVAGAVKETADTAGEASA